jgi:arsenate reductase-like glutaredoxin family protein
MDEMSLDGIWIVPEQIYAVAIDGSKFTAVNHREKNFTKDRLAKWIAAIESTIDRYLKELDRADREQDVTRVPVPCR